MGIMIARIWRGWAAVMEGPAISALVHWDEHVIHHVVEVNAPG
jgi:hypothetical protein